VARLFGREAELERIGRQLESARRGLGSVVLVTGEPGIGKSSLGRELALRAVASGMRVAAGRCWEAGGAPAYWPWVQVFRELGSTPFDGLVRAEAGDSRERRFQLFEAATRALTSVAAEQPLLVFLDDLHAADLPTLLLLSFLSRQLAGSPLVVLGTSRDVEARLSPEVADTLAKIGREGEVLSLARLSRADLAAWVGTREHAPSAEELFHSTEGNPLFVEEMLRIGLRGRAQLPSISIQTALDGHLQPLSGPARTQLEVAAVLGRDFGSRELAELTAERHDTVLACVRHAAELRIVEEPEPEHFQFTHVLLRDRLHEALAPERRSELHWRAGLLLERRGADPATVANQLLEGASAGAPERAAASALGAARHMLRGLAFEAAAALAERGLTLLGGAPSRLACQLETLAGEAQIGAGAGERGRAHCVRAADRAQELGCVEEQAQAALAYALEVAPIPVMDPVMVRLLEAGRAAVGAADSALGVRLAARLHAALMPPRSDAEAAHICDLGRGALGMARRLGDDETLLYALEWARLGLSYLIPSEERFEITRDIVQLAERMDQRRTLVRFLASHAVALLERGARQDAEAAQSRLERVVAALDDQRSRWRLPMLHAGFCFFDGDLDAAERLGDEALELGERAGANAVYVHWANQRIALAIARRDPERIKKDAARVLSILVPSIWAAGARAWVLAALGRRDEARAALRLTQHGFPPLIMGADACTLLLDREAAALFQPLLAERSCGAQFFWGSAGCHIFGPTSRLLGDLARLCGQTQRARRHYADAIEVCRRIGAPGLLEHAALALERLNAEGAAADSLTPAALPAPAPGPSSPEYSWNLTLTREGDVWAVQSVLSGFRLKHSKGLGYLSELLASPGRELHVLALVGLEHGAGDAGPVLDEHAKAEYKRRFLHLTEEISEAEGFGDAARAARARQELELLAGQLASAVGLGGRNRRAASDIERARINVQRRLKDAIESIGACDAALGRYLSAAVKTGTYCSFTSF
jgi:hypothetical protein